MCLPTWELCQCAKPPQGRDNALGAEELPPFYCSPKAGGWTAESQGLQMQSTKTAAENQGVCCQGQLEHQTAGKWSLDKVSQTRWALGTPPVPGTLCLWWFNFVICPIDTQKCIFKSKHHFFSDEITGLFGPVPVTHLPWQNLVFQLWVTKCPGRLGTHKLHLLLLSLRLLLQPNDLPLLQTK